MVTIAIELNRLPAPTYAARVIAQRQPTQQKYARNHTKYEKLPKPSIQL